MLYESIALPLSYTGVEVILYAYETLINLPDATDYTLEVSLVSSIFLVIPHKSRGDVSRVCGTPAHARDPERSEG